MLSMLPTEPAAQPTAFQDRHVGRAAHVHRSGAAFEAGSLLFVSPVTRGLHHQNTVGNLYFALRAYVDAHRAGRIFMAPAEVKVPPVGMVQPDLFFVSAERLELQEDGVQGVPDLVVEVLSPASAYFDRRTKYALYEQVGVREYWMVDPAARCVDVYVHEGDAFVPFDHYAEGDLLRSRVLCGLALPSNVIFG